MIDEHAHEHDHDHGEEGAELNLDAQSRIFLEMRAQNIELLKIAAEVAGHGRGPQPPKPHEARQSLKAIWDLYSEFYSWVDPEESAEDEDEDEE